MMGSSVGFGGGLGVTMKGRALGPVLQFESWFWPGIIGGAPPLRVISDALQSRQDEAEAGVGEGCVHHRDLHAA
jgi:hypothetical protein